jgi:hypothetical protein
MIHNFKIVWALTAQCSSFVRIMRTKLKEWNLISFLQGQRELDSFWAPGLGYPWLCGWHLGSQATIRHPRSLILVDCLGRVNVIGFFKYRKIARKKRKIM